MRKQVEVRYLDQNIGAVLKVIMDDPEFELKFFEGLKKPAITAQELIRISEERTNRNNSERE